MASPYSPWAIQQAKTTMPSGYHALTDSEFNNFNNVYLTRMPAAEAAIAALQIHVPVKLIEPVCAAGEILFTSDGDCLVSWGGSYVA